ncbi:redoxin domain-containing protein [Epibacterium sp. MM17-32]|uniref:redoxin domain-containing protein n=1 Tax=Epibacterium sp. MM17-32 TaxID=2917734 RepID=UPI001EF4B27B|nr:redoxin domain-containing protein [Epibacterium sp. MM17-32]MCG7627002.1 redoxin domain-containing protein [Epibacterium sp. MM17-32]
MTSPKLAAGTVFPAITLPVLDGGTRDISTPAAGFDWMLVVVYRGKHCPLCTQYLRQLNDTLDDLHALGVDVVAVSADSAVRAAAQMAEVNPRYEVAYGLSVDQMQALGLYVSDPRNGQDVSEPFAEPGLFVLNEDRVLQIIDISNVPFARPDLAWIAKGIGFRRGPMKAAPVNGTYAA